LLDEAAMVLKRMLGAHSVGFSRVATRRIGWFPGAGLEGVGESVVPALAALLQPGAAGVRLQDPPGGPFGSAIVTALVSRSVDIGSLALLRTGQDPPFTEEEYRRALVFSGQLALALDNARLHEELSAKVEEVTRTRDALIFAEKLALTGQLTAGVAHEISTPLTYVRFNLEFVVDAADQLVEQIKANATDADKAILAKACESLAELRTAAADAREGVERIVKIVSDLNMFARPDHDQQSRLQITKVLEWASNVAAVQIKPKARLVKNYEADAVVRGNETRLGQVFVNLLVNAAQAISAGAPADNSVTLTAKVQAEGVVVEVSDTGSGIDAVAAAHIFEPFFTTKPPGKGTGLGLSICRSIVTEHGGSITFESTPGVGTTFRVKLPFAHAADPGDPTEVPPTLK
jgi:signal transduction histidine kinase